MEAKEWILFSLEPIAVTVAEGGDPFADPPKGTVKKEEPPPKPPLDPDQIFHDYPILGQTKVVVTPELKTVITTLDEAGRHWGGAVAMCFNPRHGIRVIKGGKTYDLVICYECMAADLYADEKWIGSIFFATEAGLLPRPAYLNGALMRAKVKLPDPPRH
ncbi:MAG: hypothetical protein KDK97_18980 [Verrucomicrobiales bacterium]|nr:hypothetical protein [Verrucomicrobiales bacterium]MCP5558258.1 hypothetical protein [Verrucomicrobiaceae bacterium]